ncbi:MAG: hypothetical protein ACOZNI_29055 [Myxococcota bacterium]
MRFLVCALANEPDGGVIPAEPRLDGLDPRRSVARVQGGYRILPTPRPCTTDGTVWVLRAGRPTPASEDERALLDDACGRGSFELAWFEGALDGWPGDSLPACMTIEYAAFDTGAAEAEAHAITPMHARRLAAPFPDAASAVVSDVLVRHGRAPDLLERVLTELIANAVGHRGYAPQYIECAVVVEDFTDLVSVRSPGAPPRPVVQPDGSLRGRWSRNSRLMARLGEACLVHQQGRGLAIAPRLARDAGYEMRVRVEIDQVIAELVPDPSRWDHAPDRLRQCQPEAVRADRIVDHIQSCMEASVADISTALWMPVHRARVFSAPRRRGARRADLRSVPLAPADLPPDARRGGAPVVAHGPAPTPRLVAGHLRGGALGHRSRLPGRAPSGEHRKRRGGGRGRATVSRRGPRAVARAADGRAVPAGRLAG